MAAIINPYAYLTEAALCADYIAEVTRTGEWLAYPETAGWDILLVRVSDGLQIGIEAKLRLNAEVIHQAAEQEYWYNADKEGPDYRAVLIPWDKQGGALHGLLRRLHITAIYFGKTPNEYKRYDTTGKLPDFSVHQEPKLSPESEGRYGWREQWYDMCPTKRHALPEYIPDCGAGNPSPIQLTDWKVKAIKIAVIAETVGFVTRRDFTYLQISMPRWTQCAWLAPGEFRGQWKLGEQCPPFARQHPKNYETIKATYDNWKEKTKEAA